MFQRNWMNLFKNIDFLSFRRHIPHKYILKMPYYEYYYIFKDEYELYKKEIDAKKEEIEQMNQIQSQSGNNMSDIPTIPNYSEYDL